MTELLPAGTLGNRKGNICRPRSDDQDASFKFTVTVSTWKVNTVICTVGISKDYEETGTGTVFTRNQSKLMDQKASR
jgi:hypothetical protein